MEGKMEQEKRKEELKRKLEEFLNEYNEERIPLSREEIKGLRDSVGGVSLIPPYEKSKYRRSWLGSVFGQFSIGEMYGIEPEFFIQKMNEMQNFLPFFNASHKELESEREKAEALRKSNEFEITPEIVERVNQMLREAIAKLS